MRSKAVVSLVCGVLIFLFLYTAVSKVIGYAQQVAVLHQSPLLHTLAPVLGWLIPLVETGIVFLLIFPATQRWGLYSSLALLILFTGYIGYMLLWAPHLPCGCGGVIRQLTWKQHFLFNLFFVLLTLLGIYFRRSSPKAWHPRIPYPDKEDLL